jgi:thioredoxin reductase (NADPH)
VRRLQNRPAAVYGGSEGLSTILIEQGAPGGQAGTSSRIENYLGFVSGISGGELAHRALQQAKRLGAEVLVTRRVREIRAKGAEFAILLDDGAEVRARSVVLATGVAWRKLATPGVDACVGRGVYYGASRAEAYSVRGKDIFLVGGGNSAGQAAMFFSRYARNVTILIRGSRLERTMSQYLVEQIHSVANIVVETHTTLEAVEGNGFGTDRHALDRPRRGTGARGLCVVHFHRSRRRDRVASRGIGTRSTRIPSYGS